MGTLRTQTRHLRTQTRHLALRTRHARRADAMGKIYTQPVCCTDSRKIRGCLGGCLALSRAVSRCLALSRA
eukprot:5804434-Prymnesium_polylepis.1